MYRINHIKQSMVNWTEEGLNYGKQMLWKIIDSKTLRMLLVVELIGLGP